MADQSYLDNRYFVDGNVFNCPFCNRKHVSYWVYNFVEFDWTDSRTCTCYFVQCNSCRKRSMHLTYQILTKTQFSIGGGDCRFHFAFKDGEDAGAILDSVFFYSVPTSFFALDNRIPRVLRELLTEAEGCLKSNFLTGASACARKIIYELGKLHEASGDSYEDRIKSLKEKLPRVDPTFFDTLLSIQQVTSTKVHENADDGWEAKHVRIILLALREALHEIYVVPAQRADRRRAVLALKDELLPNKTNINSAPEAE